MKKEHDKIGKRLGIIITKLNNGERFTAEELAEEFNVNVRTIQRDLKDRLFYIPLKNEQNYYFLPSHALGKLSYKDIQNFAHLSGISSLYPSLDHSFISDLLELKFNSLYMVKNHGFENIADKKELFEQLSGAITRQSPVHFIYNDKQRSANPYKLINNNGIWYLLTDENGDLKTFTFSKIKQLKWDFQIHFSPKYEFLKQIENNESNWFSKELIEVVLEVENIAKEYFFRKETLPNKKILEQDEHKLIISTQIAYDDEIIHLVKYWIPYIKIVSPLYLQEKLSNVLEGYLKTTQPVKE